MILRVEITRRDSGEYCVTITHAGGYVEDVGPFRDLWEACSVVGGIEEYRETLTPAEIDHETLAPAEIVRETLTPAEIDRETLTIRRRRGDTEPITFDAAAAAAARLRALDVE